jgi:hypothetical protein
MLPARTASSQTLDGSKSVQPDAARAAQRHQTRLTDNDALVDAVAKQARQRPVNGSRSLGDGDTISVGSVTLTLGVSRLPYSTETARDARLRD